MEPDNMAVLSPVQLIEVWFFIYIFLSSNWAAFYERTYDQINEC